MTADVRGEGALWGCGGASAVFKEAGRCWIFFVWVVAVGIGDACWWLRVSSGCRVCRGVKVRGPCADGRGKVGMTAKRRTGVVDAREIVWLGCGEGGRRGSFAFRLGEDERLASPVGLIWTLLSDSLSRVVEEAGVGGGGFRGLIFSGATASRKSAMIRTNAIAGRVRGSGGAADGSRSDHAYDRH